MSEKRLIVTCASSGIGEAVARQAVARGWQVLAVARRAERLEALSADIGCETFVADLTDFAVEYAMKTRTDHALFVEAFREGRIGGVSATT